MAQPLKDRINLQSVSALADGLAAAWPPFPRGRFVARALDGLGGLELKDRVRHVAGALHEALPLPYPEAAAVVRACASQGALDLWSGWPATDHTAAHGLGHLEEAMATLAALTPYATGEFAVRPFLERHRDDALKIMLGWAESPDEHLRRLASEGSRPRLPWAARVPWLMTPGPTLPVLDRLRDDPSEYVRRSVANHVNDLAKDHPEVALGLLARWRSDGGSHVEQVLRHAVRGLLRAGHPEALALVGAVPGSGEVDALSLEAGTVAVGGRLAFTVTVTSGAAGPLLLKYAVRRPGSRRVFHLTQRQAGAPGATFTVRKTHSFRPVTTRDEPPGPRELDIILNGRVAATTAFTLTGPGSATP
ncbi:DNA alkylation repair protein [Actinomadura sp. ATCC 31491]|uniref:DNA alkylation repair protein n=1 Tax=Actinomadura luzonensis TaxID=2805427 RepID=A0ABT0G848_9ACTN|nr:DNA alkylation repair protein [Actinomadura luzonensis]MCK2220578.1 DNA alkylation repair protein [Actinomadura luzonensis]